MAFENALPRMNEALPLRGPATFYICHKPHMHSLGRMGIKKTICKISKEKCNPWVGWRVLWNEWGIILLLTITNALYFCIIWLWECAIRRSDKATAVSSLYVILSVTASPVYCLGSEAASSMGAAGSDGHRGSWHIAFCTKLWTAVNRRFRRWLCCWWHPPAPEAVTQHSTGTLNSQTCNSILEQSGTCD